MSHHSQIGKLAFSSAYSTVPSSRGQIFFKILAIDAPQLIRQGKSFVSVNPVLCPAPVTAVHHAKLCYVAPPYNGTSLHSGNTTLWGLSFMLDIRVTKHWHGVKKIITGRNCDDIACKYVISTFYDSLLETWNYNFWYFLVDGIACRCNVEETAHEIHRSHRDHYSSTSKPK